MLSQVDEFFSLLIQFLSDPSKEVKIFTRKYYLNFKFLIFYIIIKAVELDLKILATISSSSFLIKTTIQDEHMKKLFPKYNIYFTKFMTQLLDLFRRDTNLRYEKGSNIIK